MYSASNIAAFIINWCHDHNFVITNLKLQKLLYFVQGNYYKQTKSRLIDAEFFAWQLGPVIPEIYSKYAIYSATPIPPQPASHISPQSANHIEQILQKYAPLSAWQLVEISHKEDPWKYNFEIFGDKSQIPFASIANYYGGATNNDY